MTQAEKLYKLKHVMEHWVNNRSTNVSGREKQYVLMTEVYEQDLSWVEKRIKETIDLGRKLTLQEMRIANFNYLKWKNAPLGCTKNDRYEVQKRYGIGKNRARVWTK